MTDDPRVLHRQATILEQLEKAVVLKIMYVRYFRVSLRNKLFYKYTYLRPAWDGVLKLITKGKNCDLYLTKRHISRQFSEALSELKKKTDNLIVNTKANDC